MLRTASRLTLVAAALALSGSARPGSAEGQGLDNPSFERVASGQAGSDQAGSGPGGSATPAGWSAVHGAGFEGGTPSRVEVVELEGLDRKAPTDGKRALRLSADARTGSFQFVSQTLPARPGYRWTLDFAVRSEAVRAEGAQFHNAYVRVGFLGADGQLLASDMSPPLTGTRGWARLRLTAIAPEGTAVLQVACFLSMSGALWLDDLRLEAAPVAPFSDRAVREAAYDAFAQRLTATYPFFALESAPDHRKLLAKHRAKAIKKDEPREFARALGKVLDELDDLHMGLSVNGERIETEPRRNPHPTNWNMKAVAERVTELAQGPTYLVGRIERDGDRPPIGYVRLSSFAAQWEHLQSADRAMDRMDDVAGWIIDVRANGGGGEDKAKLFAARFVDERVEYARSRYRDPFAPDDVRAFTEDYPRWLAPREGDDGRPRACDGRPVAVLQGPFCVSSTEGFLLMMDALENATLVGLPSRGYSANPRSYALTPEITLTCSRWQSLTLAGECIERRGVLPDVEVDERPSRYLKADPTFERALSLFE